MDDLYYGLAMLPYTLLVPDPGPDLSIQADLTMV